MRLMAAVERTLPVLLQTFALEGILALEARSARGLVMVELVKLPGGVVHDLPDDVEQALMRHPDARSTWEDITSLARNEWICWIESAKKEETRRKRIDWACSSLSGGKRRPCCWPGCPHR
jgi:hypothetical protein